MANPARESRPGWPLKVCPACGGDWFREADYYRFLREETLRGSWPTWPVLVGQLGRGAMTLLVCLCGSPLAPDIGGVRGGRAFNTELIALLASLQKAREGLEEARRGDSVLAALRSVPLASPETFAPLATRLENVARRFARRMRSGPGRPWRSPKRMPRARGRDQLVLAVEQRVGLTARKAREVVDQFWRLMARVIRRGEVVETPLGVFQAVAAPAPQKRERWGKDQIVYRRPRRIVFRPRQKLLGDD